MVLPCCEYQSASTANEHTLALVSRASASPLIWGGRSRHQQQLLHSASASSASGVALSCAAPGAPGATLSECARDD
eukprot:11197314-Lingulodinium_polyedra.AAC.1